VTTDTVGPTLATTGLFVCIAFNGPNRQSYQSKFRPCDTNKATL